MARDDRSVWCGFALGLALALSAGCQSSDEALRAYLDEWDAQLVRYAWSCDAMGQALETWLNAHEAELEALVESASEHASQLEPAERQRYLGSFGSGRTLPEATQARAECSAHGRVRAANARLARLLTPLWALARPNTGSPPTHGSDTGP